MECFGAALAERCRVSTQDRDTFALLLVSAPNLHFALSCLSMRKPPVLLCSSIYPGMQPHASRAVVDWLGVVSCMVRCPVRSTIGVVRCGIKGIK
jgi:hypothetical protein